MAQSIRISDELHSLAQSTGHAPGRPIAQQMEYRAGLAAALEAAGICSASAMHLLGAKGSADELVSEALGELQMSESERIRMLRMSDADQVTNGKRTAKSLFVVRKEALEGFTFKRQVDPEPKEGEGW